MSIPQSSEVLFTRQRHEADRAGLHWDYRVVIGDKAYSWATKKEMPPTNGSIILWEQPVHDREYALSDKVVIPKGQYGGGTTTLDWVKKGFADVKDDHVVITTKSGERYFLKHMPSWDPKAWLFVNLPGKAPETLTEKVATLLEQYKTKEGKTYWVKDKAEPHEGSTPTGAKTYVRRKIGMSKLAEITSELLAKFKPDLTPDEMKQLGVLSGKYDDKDPTKANFFKVDASLKEWNPSWYHESAPKGWWEWYQNYSNGVRTEDDERQIKRWISFKARHLAGLAKKDPTLVDLSIAPRRRQALLHWGIAPGIEKNKYLPGSFVMQKDRSDTNAFLMKAAAVLQEHQERALKKLNKTNGVLLDHSTGSGKTLTFLTAIERDQKKNPTGDYLVVAPASLVTNIDKEIQKHKLNIDRKRLEAYSYEKATNIASELKKKKYNLVAFDEAHKVRNTDTQRYKELSEVLANSRKKILATATSGYNHVSDVAPLINLVSGRKLLPEAKKEFEDKYIDKKTENPPLLKRILGASPKEVSSLKNTKKLGEILNEYMDTYDLADDPKAKDKFPSKTEEIVESEMSNEQKALYKYMEGKLPFHLRMKVRMNLPLDKKESQALNAFSSGVRQVSNSVRPFMPKSTHMTPKIQKALENLQDAYKKDKQFRGVVYSNYIDAGLKDYSEGLRNLGIPHTVYTGALNRKQKDEAIENYNSGKSPVLLVSSSGAEGLNLKGTRLMQILEPHFNKSKIDQVMGRAIRFESHDHLPESKRNVKIEHHQSVLPKSLFGKRSHSIDQYLYANSENKNNLTKEIKELTKEESGKKAKA